MEQLAQEEEKLFEKIAQEEAEVAAAHIAMKQHEQRECIQQFHM